MTSNPNDRETEAYFLRFMGGELRGEETVKVMMNPMFWDFLASTLSKHAREWLADEMVRRTMDGDATDPEHVRINEKVLEGAKAVPTGEQRLQECDENFRALYADVPQGGKFEFLRDWFCSVGEGKDPREAGDVGREAGKENEKSEAQDQNVWEWTESDAEAELWLFERHAVAAGDVAWKENGKSSAEVESGWEWNEYDSEAEREEAERRLS